MGEGQAEKATADSAEKEKHVLWLPSTATTHCLPAAVLLGTKQVAGVVAAASSGPVKVVGGLPAWVGRLTGVGVAEAGGSLFSPVSSLLRHLPLPSWVGVFEIWFGQGSASPSLLYPSLCIWHVPRHACKITHTFLEKASVRASLLTPPLK